MYVKQEADRSDQHEWEPQHSKLFKHKTINQIIYQKKKKTKKTSKED